MDTNDLQHEISRLRMEVARLNNLRFIKVHNSVPRLILFQLYRGIAFGLGTALGATAVLSLLIWSLSQINFIPVIGDFATQILESIQAPAGE